MKKIIITHHVLPVIAVTLISVFCIFPAFPAEKEEITCELHEIDEFRLRVYLFFETFSFFIINKTGSIGETDIIFGFSGDRISFGPMYTYGLFREIYNPLGYSLNSTVFSEESDLRLKGSFEPGPKRFLFLSLFPGFISIFFQAGEDIPLWEKVPLFCGGLLSLSLGELWKTELLYSISRPPEEMIDDTWFADSYQFSGGIISHLCMKNIVETDHYLFSLSGGISGGDMTLPGLFFHGNVAGQFHHCVTSCFLGYCSAYYTTPDGSYKDNMIKTGGTLSLSPLPWYTIYLCSFLGMDHPSPFPEESLSATYTINGDTSFRHHVWRDTLMTINISGKKICFRNREKEKKTEHEITISAEMEAKHLAGEMVLLYSLSREEESSVTWRTSASLEIGPQSFAVQSNLYKEDDLSWKGKLDYSLHLSGKKKDRLTAWVTLSMKKPILLTESGFQENQFKYITVSLGCKTDAS